VFGVGTTLASRGLPKPLKETIGFFLTIVARAILETLLKGVTAHSFFYETLPSEQHELMPKLMRLPANAQRSKEDAPPRGCQKCRMVNYCDQETPFR
jgi:hypothetical protein